MTQEQKMELEIEIRGAPGAGKTQVAHAIMHLLRHYRFDAKLIDDPNEPSEYPEPPGGERMMRAIGDSRTVTVRTRCTRKGG